VNFDNEGTLIKELMFVKTTGQLIYQLQNDRDPLGRIWASSQLSLRMREEKTSPADREAILKALSQAVTKEQFWGARVEILVALNGVKEAREALLAGTKDADARVRPGRWARSQPQRIQPSPTLTATSERPQLCGDSRVGIRAGPN
jgi:hypothetical protein